MLDPRFFHAQLSGISLPVELTVAIADKPTARAFGSLLFTHFGISGPAVLDISRDWTIAAAEGMKPQLLANLLPGRDRGTIDADLLGAAKTRPRAQLKTWLETLLPTRLAHVLGAVDELGEVTLGQLSRSQRRHVLQRLTALAIPVQRARGWDFAEVTAGGVPLAEIDYRTMESRRQPGLYLVGEMLDCDGRIGGFNFQWAWATGHIAGSAAARSF